ncbi:hypothetical protein MHYP_G00140640 [Metynnis hypsauchen]
MAAAASPGSCSSNSSDWVVLRDGCLRCDEEGLRSLSYHPALNAILAVTSRGSIKVIDGTSGAILQASALHAKPGGRVRCQYFPAVDKVLFVDDYAVGCRKDLNGILLLDTALQAPVSKPEDMVQLELPVTEITASAHEGSPQSSATWPEAAASKTFIRLCNKGIAAFP